MYTIRWANHWSKVTVFFSGYWCSRTNRTHGGMFVLNLAAKMMCLAFRSLLFSLEPNGYGKKLLFKWARMHCRILLCAFWAKASMISTQTFHLIYIIVFILILSGRSLLNRAVLWIFYEYTVISSDSIIHSLCLLIDNGYFSLFASLLRWYLPIYRFTAQNYYSISKWTSKLQGLSWIFSLYTHIIW